MHMIIEKEKCLSLLHNPYITPYSIKSMDNKELHEEDLEKIVASASEITALPVDKALQQYRISCHNNSNIVAFTIKNPTKDQLFLTEYLQNKLHSFNELIDLLDNNKVFATGLILEDSSTPRFDACSTFEISHACIRVSSLAYPYPIHRSQFAYFRKTDTIGTFDPADTCLYIYYTNGTYVKLFYTDLSTCKTDSIKQP